MMSVVMAMGRRALFIHAMRLHVFVARIQALHGFQHARRAGLHRQMHVIAQRRIARRWRRRSGLHEIARMRGGEAHAPDARDAARLDPAAWRNPSRPATGRDSCSRSAPAVEFRCSPMRASCARFGDHRCAGAAALRPARERHHAIGAGLVAAFDDGDVGAMRIVAARERGLEGVVGIEAQAR